ncbi:DUF418 domain-containing protein [Ammonicoccus fulvus]|uniref:DUF418 domain-containing protein n=1 Tax=Ammonicoccus fulvus TaxID=3138240 RepID=A0ABZ3FKE9_9ACTN
MRLVWPDLSRGVAVLAMFVAHTAPGGGPLLLSEFLAAPLFAMLVVASLGLSWERRSTSAGRWYLVQALRGLLLIMLGVLLQGVYAQIVIVLQTLGGLTIVAAALVPVLASRPLLALLGGVVGMVVSPWLMGAARSVDTTSALGGWVLDVLATGSSYRVLTFLVFGLFGLALSGLIRSRWWVVGRGAVIATLVTGVWVAIFAVDRLGDQSINARFGYTGTTFAIFLDVLISATVVLAAALAQPALGRKRADRVFRPLTATGRLALTAYVLQIVLLAVIVRFVLDGGADDGWGVLGFLILSIVGFCTLWDVRGWPRPVESLLRLPGHLLARRTGGDDRESAIRGDRV